MWQNRFSSSSTPTTDRGIHQKLPPSGSVNQFSFYRLPFRNKKKRPHLVCTQSVCVSVCLCGSTHLLWVTLAVFADRGRTVVVENWTREVVDHVSFQRVFNQQRHTVQPLAFLQHRVTHLTHIQTRLHHVAIYYSFKWLYWDFKCIFTAECLLDKTHKFKSLLTI